MSAICYVFVAAVPVFLIMYLLSLPSLEVFCVDIPSFGALGGDVMRTSASVCAIVHGNCFWL